MPRKTNTKSSKKKRRTMDEILAEEEAQVEEEVEEEIQAEEEEEEEVPVEVLQVIPGPPLPQVEYYNYKTAMKRVAIGVKVCRSVWLPECFLTDEHRRVNGRGATLPWNPGREDSNAKDWMDYAVRLQGGCMTTVETDDQQMTKAVFRAAKELWDLLADIEEVAPVKFQGNFKGYQKYVQEKAQKRYEFLALNPGNGSLNLPEKD